MIKVLIVAMQIKFGIMANLMCNEKEHRFILSFCDWIKVIHTTLDPDPSFVPRYIASKGKLAAFSRNYTLWENRSYLIVPSLGYAPIGYVLAIRKIRHAVVYGDICSGRLAYVFDIEYDLGLVSTLPLNRFTVNVGSGLPVADVAGVIGHLSGGFESSPNENHTAESNARKPSGNYEHSQSPRRHILLSLQIVLGLIYFIVGAWILCETNKPSSEAAFVHDGIAGIDALFGCFAIVAGAVIAFIGLVLLVG